MKFFLPDWDDRIDPGYDFLSDKGTLRREPSAHDLYAHEVLGESAYDGILLSLMALRKNGPKRKRIDETGLKRFLRLPPRLEIFADCGAFGYVGEKRPPFSTTQAVELYEQLGFDYGVSIDHAIVTEFAHERKFRYDLTLRNADEFIRQCHRSTPNFLPVGAIQGWDSISYLEAAKATVAMGYKYIAIGGLARSPSSAISRIVEDVIRSLPQGISVHLFGVGRLSLMRLFISLGITSIDSATPIRQAWLSPRDNYYSGSRTYAAIRIPAVIEGRSNPNTLVGRSRTDYKKLRAAERKALSSLRSYDIGELKLDTAFRAIVAYDRLLADRRDATDNETRWRLYMETLKDKPWAACRCPICREIGVEVIIFRGNNRNRRRGFHNLWVLRNKLRQLSESTKSVSSQIRGGDA